MDMIDIYNDNWSYWRYHTTIVKLSKLSDLRQLAHFTSEVCQYLFYQTLRFSFHLRYYLCTQHQVWGHSPDRFQLDPSILSGTPPIVKRENKYHQIYSKSYLHMDPLEFYNMSNPTNMMLSNSHNFYKYDLDHDWNNNYNNNH